MQYSPRLQPYVFRRNLWPYCFLGILAFVLASILIFGAPRNSMMSWPMLIGGLTSCLLAIPLMALQTIRVDRLKRQARKHDNRICPACGYLLTDGEGPFRCTECGEMWSKAELREFWWPDDWPPPSPTMHD